MTGNNFTPPRPFSWRPYLLGMAAILVATALMAGWRWATMQMGGE